MSQTEPANVDKDAVAFSCPELESCPTVPSDSKIAGDFDTLSAIEQEIQRDEWKTELSKTEQEIKTLKEVLASKELHAAGLKRKLGITQWREFSEDMAQGLKSLQESNEYKKTAETFSAAKTKTASMLNSATISVSASISEWSEKAGSAFSAAKTKMASSFSNQNPGAETVKEEESGKEEPTTSKGHVDISQIIQEEK